MYVYVSMTYDEALFNTYDTKKCPTNMFPSRK